MSSNLNWCLFPFSSILFNLIRKLQVWALWIWRRICRLEQHTKRWPRPLQKSKQQQQQQQRFIRFTIESKMPYRKSEIAYDIWIKVERKGKTRKNKRTREKRRNKNSCFWMLWWVMTMTTWFLSRIQLDGSTIKIAIDNGSVTLRYRSLRSHIDLDSIWKSFEKSMRRFFPDLDSVES